jgi:hypothetical protein
LQVNYIRDKVIHHPELVNNRKNKIYNLTIKHLKNNKWTDHIYREA